MEDELKDLLKAMIQYRPEERLSLDSLIIKAQHFKDKDESLIARLIKDSNVDIEMLIAFQDTCDELLHFKNTNFDLSQPDPENIKEEIIKLLTMERIKLLFCMHKESRTASNFRVIDSLVKIHCRQSVLKEQLVRIGSTFRHLEEYTDTNNTKFECCKLHSRKYVDILVKGADFLAI